jgi:hypothetical protein
MENRHTFDRVLIKELNFEITKRDKTIADLKKQNIVKKLEKNHMKVECIPKEIVKEVFIDCSDPLNKTSNIYKKVKSLKVEELPSIDTINIGDESKIKIAPVFTPDDKFGGAKMILETKF